MGFPLPLCFARTYAPDIVVSPLTCSKWPSKSIPQTNLMQDHATPNVVESPRGQRSGRGMSQRHICLLFTVCKKHIKYHKVTYWTTVTNLQHDTRVYIYIDGALKYQPRVLVQSKIFPSWGRGLASRQWGPSSAVCYWQGNCSREFSFACWRLVQLSEPQKTIFCCVRECS